MKVSYTGFKRQVDIERKGLMRDIAAVLNRGDFILGREVRLFEEEFAKYCGAKHAIGVANGTDSLILGLLALGVGPGDEVITAPNSWISSASSIALIGAKPVFVDVCDDQNIDPDLIGKAITPRTKCIMPVHLTGRLSKMHEILHLAENRCIPVFEDAAQAVGATARGVRAGSGGRLASFSLHPLKNLNAFGDAGIITTNDDVLATKLKKMRNHGLINREEVEFFGFNSRLDTMQAAILLPRLMKLDRVINQRRLHARKYSMALNHVVKVPKEDYDEKHTYHTYTIQCERRDELQRFLAERGIETKIHYPIPIHLQQAAKSYGYGPGMFPNCEAQAKRILSLPVHQHLANEELEFVIQSIEEFYQ